MSDKMPSRGFEGAVLKLLRDGVASRWAQDTRPGDTIEVTALGSNFTLPEPAPKGYVIGFEEHPGRGVTDRVEQRVDRRKGRGVMAISVMPPMPTEW